MTARVDAQAATTEALAICAELRELDERALSGDLEWMGDSEAVWAKSNRLLALIEPIANGNVVLAARLEAAETALRRIHETSDWYAKNGQRLAHEVDHALCVEVVSYAEEGLAALAAGRGEHDATGRLGEPA